MQCFESRSRDAVETAHGAKTLQRFSKRAPRICAYRSLVRNELSALGFVLAATDQTSEWRNQSLLDYSMISKRVWKKGLKIRSGNSIRLVAVSK